MGVDIGHKYIGGFKPQTNAWGRSPMLLGADDGFEFNSESIDSNVALVMNDGLFGGPYRRKGSPGNITPGGDFPADLYYRCDPTHKMLAQIFGLDSYTSLGGGAHQHDLVMQTGALTGIFGTLVFPGPEGIKELGSAKITGVTISWDESRQRGVATFSTVAHDSNENVGSPDDDFVVVSVAAANGPLIITAAAQADFGYSAAPSPIFITKDAGVTAITVTLEVLDRFKVQRTVVLTTADFVSNVATDLLYGRQVLSGTVSGLAGAGNIKIGITNGVNNASTVSGITTSADRHEILFSQIEFLAKQQGDAGALTAATSSAENDEFFVSKLEVSIKGSPDSRVTSEYGNRISEPVQGGGGWPTCGINVGFSAHTSNSRRKLFAARAKDDLRAIVRLIGPTIPSSSPAVAQSMTLFLNAIQYATGDKKVGGPGVIPVDYAGEAHQAVAVPGDFPAGTDEPCMIRVVNGRSSAYI